MAWTTITVQEETLDRFRELKEGLNDGQPDCPDHSNESFLQSLMDTWDAADDGHYSECNVEAITEHLDDALDTASMAADPGATEEAVDDLTREVRKAQELAEQARDAAQRVEEGMPEQ